MPTFHMRREGDHIVSKKPWIAVALGTPDAARLFRTAARKAYSEDNESKEIDAIAPEWPEDMKANDEREWSGRQIAARAYET